MGIDKNVQLTEQVLTNKITENISRCKSDLKKMADQELDIVKRKAMKENDLNTLLYIQDQAKQQQVQADNVQMNYENVKVEILKQRTWISTIKIKFGKKSDEQGLTTNEALSYALIRKALNQRAIRQVDIQVKKVLQNIRANQGNIRSQIR